MNVNEATVEDASIYWFEELGYQTLYGPDIAPSGDAPDRDS
jgi:type I restriction enzyme R subunit